MSESADRKSVIAFVLSSELYFDSVVINFAYFNRARNCFVRILVVIFSVRNRNFNFFFVAFRRFENKVVCGLSVLGLCILLAFES